MKRTLAVCLPLLVSSAFCADDDHKIAEKIDAFVDSRFEAPEGASAKLYQELKGLGVESMAELESALRAPRASYPSAPVTSPQPIDCYHVDYSTKYFFYLPKGFDLKKPCPLIVVGHGGNSNMPEAYANQTAQSYLRAYRTLGDAMQAIVVAPSSCRGWGHIGNSLILSTISKMQRQFRIDPDQIYLTGQSMGGHLSYRAALSLPDRWGAVSPHSGGYNFVEKQSIAHLHNVPGYAVWGKTEPYGINTDNRINQKWGEENGLEWKFVEKSGGHTIYADEFPAIAEFFKAHKRNLYRKSVRMRQGGSMLFTSTWGVKGWPEHKVMSEERPLRWNLWHWVEVEPRPDFEEALEFFAENAGENRINITSKNVRKMTIYLHPDMVDLEQAINISVNGELAYDQKAKQDPALMLDLVREFDDRGRIFWAKVELDIQSDKDVPQANP